MSLPVTFSNQKATIDAKKTEIVDALAKWETAVAADKARDTLAAARQLANLTSDIAGLFGTAAQSVTESAAEEL